MTKPTEEETVDRAAEPIVRVAVTLGDPAGIGPEIVVRALADLPAPHQAMVFGPRRCFERAAGQLGVSLPDERVRWHDQPAGELDRVVPGRSDNVAGRLQIRSLDAAMDAVLAGEADALCTAPITKASCREAGFAFPGHTEYLAHRCGVEQSVMMLAGPRLRVVPLTGHVALREVSRQLRPERAAKTLVITAAALVRDFAIGRPRLALAGINPHAGEQGMLGEEERTVLAPALELAREQLLAEGIEATLAGPLPADGLFSRDHSWDAVACCYHDQAMIPIKIRHPDDAVNITLGLPTVRTSPAHGSALDIAGQAKADPRSMVAAILQAIQLVSKRKTF